MEGSTVDIGERLAAFVAGDLDADERTALEAELARDPALRAQLERIRRVDVLLGSLPKVEPRAGFSARLHEAVGGEIQRLGPVVPRDELAVRRDRRRVTWARGFAAAAAAAAVVGVAALGITSLLPSDDGSFTASAPEADAEAGDAAAFVRFSDRDYDESSVLDLVDDPQVVGLVGEGLTPEEARVAGADAFGRIEDDSAADQADGQAEVAAEPDADSPAAVAPQTLSGDPTVAVLACLETILGAGDELVVPVLAEVARFEGEAAYVYVLATRDPESGRHARIELWVVDPADCHVRHFAQRTR